MWGVFNQEIPVYEQQSRQNTLPPIQRNRSQLELEFNASPNNSFLDRQQLSLRDQQQVTTQRQRQQNYNTTPMETYENQSILPFVATSASRKEVTELNTKLRELEINLMDLKSSVERRISSIIEEFPAKFQRELKNIESRDQHLWKDQDNKYRQLSDQVMRLNENMMSTKSDMKEKQSNYSGKITEFDYKIQNLVKTIENLQGNYSAGAPPSGKNKDNGNEFQKYESESQINYLREQLSEERKKRELFQEEQYKNNNYFQSLVNDLHSQLMNKLKEHRSEQLSMYTQGEDERQRIEKMKLERQESDNQYIKQMISTIEKRIDEENQFRAKNEEDLRVYFETKFVGFQEKFKNEEKLGLERERRLLQQFQEGLSTMNDIIKGTKEQSLISLTHQQTVLGDQIQNLHTTLTNVKDTLYGRQESHEQDISEQRQKLQDLEQASFKHAQNVSETLENEINRFERVISAFEKYIDNQTGDLRILVNKTCDENSKWRNEYEEENNKKIIEIHNALKLLNGNLSKGNSDAKDRFDIIQKEMKNFEYTTRQWVEDLNNKVEVDDASLEERIQLAVERVNERLKSDIEKAVLDYNKLVNENHQLIQDKFINNNEEFKQFIDLKTNEMKNRILDERKKLDTIVEGKCQAYTIEIERKIIQKVNSLMVENQTLREDLVFKLDKAYKELEEVTRALQDERMKIDAKLGAKEHEIREWCLQQVQENYTDYNRLLNAKLTELENKLKQMMQGNAKQDQYVKDPSGVLSDLTLKESIENLGLKLKNEMMQLYEDDKKMKNIRFHEVFNLMESNKNLINEHIGQQFESLKALMKAYVNKEVAERTVGDESVLGQINKRLDGIDQLFDSKLKEEVHIMNEKMQSQQEMLDKEKEENMKAREDMNSYVKKVEQEQNEKLDNFKSDLDQVIQGNKEKQEEDLKKTKEELNKEIEEEKKRQDATEVKQVMDDILNKVSQDYMDQKFEQALNEVAQAIDQYVGIVNDTSSKQYDDFNQNLKKAFGQNLEQIQDLITNLNEEQELSKEKISKMQLEMNEIDYNAKKSIEEMSDKMEVERCVIEMVSWVSEQLIQQQTYDNLTKLSKSMSKRRGKSADKNKQQEQQKEGQKEEQKEEQKQEQNQDQNQEVQNDENNQDNNDQQINNPQGKENDDQNQ